MKSYNFVLEFQKTYNRFIGNTKKPSVTTGHEELRHNLIVEEILETLKGIMLNDDVEYADGLADMEYVIQGAAITYGITLRDYSDDYTSAYFDKTTLLGTLVLGTSLLKEDVEAEDIDAVRADLSVLLSIVRRLSQIDEVPQDDVLSIVHASNMSKLGADGKPIYREDGKVLKGPNYWEPKAKIKELLGG